MAREASIFTEGAMTSLEWPVRRCGSRGPGIRAFGPQAEAGSINANGKIMSLTNDRSTTRAVGRWQQARGFVGSADSVWSVQTEA